MTRFRALNIGVIAGCLAGSVVHAARALWMPPPMVVTARVPYALPVEVVPVLPPGTPAPDPHDGGVDEDAQVVTGDDEGIAVELDGAHGGVVDDLVLRRVPQVNRGVGLPQLDEPRAVRCEVGDEAPQ